MILRLIDIVLTLFFGFICIATIDMSGQVRLAASPYSDQYPVLPDMRTISVDCDGNIRLSNDRVTITEDQFEELLDQEISRMASSNDEDPRIIIKVKVDRRCPMSAIRGVIRMCHERNITCSISVKQIPLESRGAA